MMETEHFYSDRHGNKVSVFIDELDNVTEREQSPATGWRVLCLRVAGGISWEPDLAKADRWMYLGQPIELDNVRHEFSHLISSVPIDHGGVVDFIRKDGAAAQTLSDESLVEDLKLFFEEKLDEVFLADADNESILQLKRDGLVFFNEDFDGGNQIPVGTMTIDAVITFLGFWIEKHNAKL